MELVSCTQSRNRNYTVIRKKENASSKILSGNRLLPRLERDACEINIPAVPSRRRLSICLNENGTRNDVAATELFITDLRQSYALLFFTMVVY